MENFEIIEVNDEYINVLIIMKTSVSPLEFIDEIQEKLSKLEISGEIVIDGLLHSGNTDERFILGTFNGTLFDNKSFRFEKVARRSNIRRYMCECLKSDKELLSYSCLTERQQKLILKDCII